MIDFTNCKELGCTYGGSEKKKKVIYNETTYLLKFPDPVREQGNSLSYMNNQYSEYVGCHILNALGIEAQETLLGTYLDGAKNKVVVACKDFTSSTLELIEFSKVANSVTKTDSDYSCCIEDVYSVIANSEINNKSDVIKSFWDLFVADALIGNPDRHLDNWGLLYDVENDLYKFSVVYDCGSSLHALLSDEKKEAALKNRTDMKNYAYNVVSAYRLGGKRVSYAEIFKNPPEDLKEAIIRIAPRIDMNKINDILANTPLISELDKKFFKESIKIRKEEIIDKAYNIIKNEIDSRA